MEFQRHGTKLLSLKSKCLGKWKMPNKKRIKLPSRKRKKAVTKESK